jgi:hypothetical protein
MGPPHHVRDPVHPPSGQFLLELALDPRAGGRASRPVRTPPQPMMGTSGSASLTAHTQRTAIGRIAGPDSPPESPARAGRNVTGSIAIPGSVLIMERPSAPAATQARATETMSVTSGDSLAKTGMS